MSPPAAPGSIGFGLVGCGGIGSLRAQALLRVANVRLVAVSDVEPARAITLARRSGAQAESDWRRLIERPDIAVVMVATPPHLHSEMCAAALQAGKHVLCEKPLARTPAEAREVVELAERHGLLLATGFNYRFYPSFARARALLDSGIIGQLDHIRAYAGYSADDHNPEWVHDFTVMGGGALRDNGIHLIDLTRWFLGDPVKVVGFASANVWRFPGCEDNGFALLHRSDGVGASLQASWTEWRGYRFGIELIGTRGHIFASCFPMTTRVLWFAGSNGRPHRRTYRFPRTFVMEHLRSYRWVVVQSFVHELHALAASLGGHSTSLATGHDGLRALEIAHAAISQPEIVHAGNSNEETR